MKPASHVLVIDDNVLNLELAQGMLEAADFEVALAVDAESALKQLRSRVPGLILIDIQLPGTDGLALLRQIKAYGRMAEVPVVAFTASAMRGDEERFLAAGCSGYLAKPIDVPTFATTVRTMLAAGVVVRRQ